MSAPRLGRSRTAVAGMLRAPIAGVAAVVLLAVATGILQGYASLGRQTIDRRGMEDFGLFYASARQYLEHRTPYGPLVRPGTEHRSDARNLNPPYVNVVFLPFAVLSPPMALLGWVLLAATIIPIADTAIVLANGGPKSIAWGVHGVTAAVMVTFSPSSNS